MAFKLTDESKPSLRYSDIGPLSTQTLSRIEGFEQMPLVSIEQAIEPITTLVSNVHDMLQAVKQKCDIPENGLSSDESASIMLYSIEWPTKEKSFYHILNNTLRSEKREQLTPWFLFLQLIITALTKIPSTKCRTVYRGVKMDLSAEYSEGKIFVWWEFASCTSTIETLENESFFDKTGIRTLFKIECDTGKDIHKYLFYPKTDEVLLLPARQFKVIGCFDQGNGLHVIHVKEIQPLFPFILLSKTYPCLTYRNKKLEELIKICLPCSTVDLSGQNLIDQDMEIIIEQVIIGKRCTGLILWGNKITSQGASILASALHNNTTLITLHLYGNHVSDIGAQSLANILSCDNTTLKRLCINSNFITDAGVQHLAQMLQTNRTLTHLALGENEIGDRGVELLGNALAHRKHSLESLSICSNKSVSDLCVDSLITMLKQNRSLKQLSMSDCSLSDKKKEKLRKLAKSKNLFNLWV